MISLEKLDIVKYPENAAFVYYFNVSDTENASPLLLSVLPSIINICNCANKYGYDILFHCFAGISRSPAVLIAWIMSKGYAFTDAQNIVSKSRPIIDLNLGFYMMLSNEWSKTCQMNFPLTDEMIHVIRSACVIHPKGSDTLIPLPTIFVDVLPPPTTPYHTPRFVPSSPYHTPRFVPSSPYHTPRFVPSSPYHTPRSMFSTPHSSCGFEQSPCGFDLNFNEDIIIIH